MCQLDAGQLRGEIMRFVGNVIWFVFGGAIVAVIWLLGAVIFAVSIVGLPVSRAAFEIAKMSAFPFGKTVIHVRELDGKGVTAGTSITGTIGFIANIVWLCTFGIVLFFGHIISGLICCLTIIGIPFGLQSFKLAAISLWPVGRRVVSVELAQVARGHNAQKQFEKIRGGAGNVSANVPLIEGRL
jgi:uncharacterized membrane protein YccF (DUF307 family)